MAKELLELLELLGISPSCLCNQFFEESASQPRKNASHITLSPFRGPARRTIGWPSKRSMPSSRPRSPRERKRPHPARSAHPKSQRINTPEARTVALEGGIVIEGLVAS